MKEFKTRVREFHKVMRALTSVWDNPKYQVLEVLVQNLGFDGSDCVGYSVEKELKRVDSILKTLEEIYSYNDNCYLTKYVYREVSDLYLVYVIMQE